MAILLKEPKTCFHPINETENVTMTNTAREPSSSTDSSRERILRMTEHKSEAELASALSDVARVLRFDYFHYLGEFVLDRHKSIRRTLSSFPSAWNQKYISSEYEEIDPILQYSHTHLTPAVWAKVCYTPEQQDLLDDAHDHGIGNGVSFPIHAKNGDIAMLSFANHVERSDTDEVIARSLAEGSLAATFVHEAMRQIVDKERNVLKTPLTRRELECLHWISMDKSNWEISKITGLSEHGVVYYVRKLMTKFDARTRHQAVARATACGLL